MLLLLFVVIAICWWWFRKGQYMFGQPNSIMDTDFAANMDICNSNGFIRIGNKKWPGRHLLIDNGGVYVDGKLVDKLVKRTIKGRYISST